MQMLELRANNSQPSGITTGSYMRLKRICPINPKFAGIFAVNVLLGWAYFFNFGIQQWIMYSKALRVVLLGPRAIVVKQTKKISVEGQAISKVGIQLIWLLLLFELICDSPPPFRPLWIVWFYDLRYTMTNNQEKRQIRWEKWEITRPPRLLIGRKFAVTEISESLLSFVSTVVRLFK